MPIKFHLKSGMSETFILRVQQLAKSAGMLALVGAALRLRNEPSMLRLFMNS